jgi:hypothetical protein
MGLQSRLLRRLPLGVRLYPLDLTFCLLGIPSAIFTLAGVSTSRALGVLPPWAELTWSVMLLVGCLAWGVGTLTTKKNGNDVVILRVELMIFGLTLVSTTSFIYAVAMIVLNGVAALLASVPLFTFAIGTYIRRVDLIGRVKEHNGP